MVINDGKGHTQQVKCGLMDKEGAFFLLLKENKTRYYKFTTESECIEVLADLCEKQRKEISDLKKALKRAQNVGA